MLLDLVPVDLRFLSHDDFISARRRQITATAADKAIMADKDPGFRVLNLTVSPFQDATTSYFHRSVGGYHGAKLARYQDLIERYLTHGRVLDMLNTRYLIRFDPAGQTVAELRTTANGPAWFVQEVVDARHPAAGNRPAGAHRHQNGGRHQPRRQCSHDGSAPGRTGGDARGEIALTEYRPNYQKYEYTASAESVAVFSEIYYKDGWTAYIDGIETPYFRADYLLRGMELPAGTHTVEWRFRAPGWNVAEGVTLASSLAILAGIMLLIANRYPDSFIRHERR